MRIVRRTVVSRNLPAPRYRYTPVVAAGPFVFVSGLIGLEPPARTSVGVAALPLGAEVEMEFQFVVEPCDKERIVNHQLETTP